MKRKEISFALLIFIFISGIFFYKTILHGFVPFPGDLLLSHYSPWKTYSYLGYIPGSFPSKDQYFDTIRQMYPWKTLAVQLIKSNQIPLWNPYNFSGAPLLANFQSSILYPFNFLYFLFPQITSWSILVFLQMVLSSFFTYLFVRKIGLTKFSSAFAAVTFGFSMYQTVWLEYNTVLQVILWLPFLLFCIEKILEKQKILWSLLLVATIATTIFAGHPQIAAYTICFSYIFAIHRIISQNISRKKISLIIFMTLLFACGVGVSGLQLLPGLELMRLSARSSHDFTFYVQKLLLQSWQWIMFFVPDFFGNPATQNYWISDTYVSKVTSVGIVAIPFIFVSILKFKDSLTRFFLCVALLLILLATANPFTNFLYKFPLAFLLTGSPALFLFLFCFSVSVLAGFGIEAFIEKKVSKKQILIPLGIVLGICWVAVFIWKPLAVTGTKSLLLQSVFFISVVIVIVLSKKLKTRTIPILICIQCIGLFYGFQKFNPFVPPQAVFPQAPVLTFLRQHAGVNRFWGFGEAGIEANFATQYGLYSAEGYDPLYPAWYGEFIQATAHGKISSVFSDQTRSDAKIAESSSDEFPTNPFRQKVLNLLGTKYIVDRVENASTENTFPPSQFSSVYKDNGWTVYENNLALPRAFLANQYKVYTSAQDFQKIFFSRDFDPSKVILFENPLAQKNYSNSPGKVSITAYTPNMITLTAQSKAANLLFLSDTYYPGWIARIDGVQTPIYKADYAFRAIEVPGGVHTVIFSYEPSSFYLGAKVSIISLLGSFLVIFLYKKFGNEA